jgi:hypothetical protein
MSNYRIVTVHNIETSELLGYWILMKEGKSYVGLAEDGKPLQFATKKEAKEYLKKTLID